MKLSKYLISAAVLVAGSAMTLLAQAPEEPIGPSGTWIDPSAVEASGLTLAEIAEIQELVRRPALPKAIEIDAYDARVALQELIDGADDTEIVAFYKVVRQTAEKRRELSAELSKLRGATRELTLGDERERPEH